MSTVETRPAELGIPTLADSSWIARRQKNTRTSILYQIPPEILLKIMHLLSPNELLVVRQVCWRFLEFFGGSTFSHMHTRRPYGTAIPCLRPPRGFKVSSLPLPHPLRPVHAHASWLKRAYADSSFSQLLRKHSLCQGCLAVWPRDCKRKPPNISKPFSVCPVCRWDRLQKPRGRRWPRREKGTNKHKSYSDCVECFGWHAKLRVCSHRHIDASTFRSWQDGGPQNTTVLFECTDCAKAIGKHGRQPIISYASSSDGGIDCIKLAWKVPVCAVNPDEPITKEILRRGLRALAESHDDLTCPHMSFADEAMMKPFYWDNCVCFRDKGSGTHCYVSHGWGKSDGCCACYRDELKDTRYVGRLMPGHLVRCSGCEFRYTWVMDGRQICLEGAVEFLRLPIALMSPSPSVKNAWLNYVDPVTYPWDSTTQHISWCDDRKCSNSRKIPATIFLPPSHPF